MNRCLYSSQHSITHSPSSSLQTLASEVSSSSTKRRRLTHLVLAYRSTMLGTELILNKPDTSRKHQPIKRAVTASLDAEFPYDKQDHNALESELELELESELDMIPIPASIERKANSVGLPFSLRIIKRKKQWQDKMREAGGSASCSVKKAFSSMVFILSELQTYTLHMRHLLFHQDLQDILVRVQTEMNASLVWLFQQVFSQTPILMVYVMLLLANFSLYSMSNNFPTTVDPPLAAVESVTTHRSHTHSKSMKTFSADSDERTTTSLGNNNGGGGKFRRVSGGADGDGRFPARGSPVRGSEEWVSGQVDEEERWNMIVVEVDRMQGLIGDGGLDREMVKRFVSPVTVRIEDEDAEDYVRTEVLYQTGLLEEPDNPLILANYAQFLYLVARDYDRAEDYFKRASMVEPKDAEALNKYASFLWQIRKDLWAAEQTYLEAISVDPSNSFYAANYAHFLWNTGGEDTCFPLDSPETTFSDDV